MFEQICRRCKRAYLSNCKDSKLCKDCRSEQSANQSPQPTTCTNESVTIQP
jgi:hypothetical protein